jgi:hypothetical protein
VRKRPKRLQALIFALLVVIPFSLACPQHDSLAGMNFLLSNLGLENFEDGGREDLALDSPANSDGILLASFVNPNHPLIHPVRDSCPFPSEVFPFEKKFPLLRC